MKRMSWMSAALCVGALLMSAQALHAGGKSFTIRGSYWAPQGASSGFSLGGSVGTQFDEVVELGVGTDIFWRNYRKTSVVAQTVSGGLVTSTTTTLVEYSTVVVPLMLELMVKIPVFPGGKVFGHGGLGYEFLFNRERNYASGVSDNRFYSGFTWLLGSGLMFKLGSESAVFVEGFYDHGKPKHDLKDPIQFLPAFEEVNLSGFGARIGFSLGPL
jgi:hypothetical protein